MKTALRIIFLVAVLLAAYGCSPYPAYEYTRNMDNYGATKMGYDLDSNAESWDRNAVRRHASMYRFKKLPFYGDSSGYVGFVINMSDRAINYRIFDADGAEMGSGALSSVWYQQQYDYHAQFVADTLNLPFGEYKIVCNYVGDCRQSMAPLHVPSPKDCPFKLQGQWHAVLK
jgi:hypothetical protein